MSKYKVGDIVTIADRGKNDVEDYPHCYVDSMLIYAGEQAIITEVHPFNSNEYSNRKFYEEPFCYKIRILSYKYTSPWNWSSAMFKSNTPKCSIF